MASHHSGLPRGDASTDLSYEDQVRKVRDRLLMKISATGDLPALGSSVSRVVQLASSDNHAVHSLAQFILSDVALTQTILRLSNTAFYRAASGGPVTTISKAIVLLGFDTIKTTALAMLLVDSMSSQQARCLRAELAHALGASIIGRELARRSHFRDAEEAAIAALFRNIGRVLVAAHDHALYTQIAAMVGSGSYTPAQASTEVMGCSFDQLAKSVMQEWGIPDSIVQALPPILPGSLKPARGRQEWLQQVAALSTEAAALIPRLKEPDHDSAVRVLLKRFGVALNLDQDTVKQLIVIAAQDSRVLFDDAGMPLEPETVTATPDTALEQADAAMPEAGPTPGVPSEFLLDRVDAASHAEGRHPSGKPFNARDLLLAGVQDVTQMIASGKSKVSDLMLPVLETLYSSMGFRFAAVCLKDVHSGQFRARIAIGEKAVTRQAGFVFSTDSAYDLFHLALENNADLMIADAGIPEVRKLLPAWHCALLSDARSFIVLPLVVNDKQIGLFYADRAQASPEGVAPDEAVLIKALKGQVMAALKSH